MFVLLCVNENHYCTTASFEGCGLNKKILKTSPLSLKGL
nr:MAG TPA: hypothetical protein [Bacteriophage sp.]